MSLEISLKESHSLPPLEGLDRESKAGFPVLFSTETQEGEGLRPVQKPRVKRLEMKQDIRELYKGTGRFLTVLKLREEAEMFESTPDPKNSSKEFITDLITRGNAKLIARSHNISEPKKYCHSLGPKKKVPSIMDVQFKGFSEFFMGKNQLKLFNHKKHFKINQKPTKDIQFPCMDAKSFLKRKIGTGQRNLEPIDRSLILLAIKKE